MPSVAGKKPVGGLAPETAPIRAQFFEQLRAKHDVAVLASLVLGAELIRSAMEVSTEVLDTVQVCTDGCLAKVAATQLFKHELT
jgi:hypothetical protein